MIPVDPDALDDVAHFEDRGKDWSAEIAAKMLFRLAARLPVNMREVISLRIGSGMSYGEISDVLGIPEGTARSRMHNAVRILREKSGMAADRKEESK